MSDQYPVRPASLFATAARGEIQLTSQYWDCECNEKFIHPRIEEACDVCGAFREDQPPSRVNEVLELGLPLKPCACTDPVHAGDNLNCPEHGKGGV